MYQKMIARVEAFYFVAEKYRVAGPTMRQMQQQKETGYPFSYQVELHRCLKHLLYNLKFQTNAKVLKLHVSEIYSWLLNKLMQMGALDRSEQMAEASILNPMARTLGTALKSVVR